MKYLEIISENKRLGSELASKEDYSIGVLSNIMVNQIKEILEYYLRVEGIHTNVELGNYDNIVQDSHNLNHHKLIIVFWEAINLIDGLQYKGDLMSDLEIGNLIERIKREIDFVLDNLKAVPMVIINQFSPLLFNSLFLYENNLDRICHELNNYLNSKKGNNLKVVNVEKVVAKISVNKSVDLRFYYTSKTLYSIDFLKEYVQYILPIPLSLNGKTKKILLFDCDNTLWKGILGEDGFDEIVMSSNQKGGVAYEEVQSLALALKNKGVLLGLCSKNNASDVDEVLVKNPNMTIRDKDLNIKMVNWDDKVSNLKIIGERLNIGLDSFVFIDDSDFEVEYIEKNLPMVKIIKVPDKSYEYPLAIRKTHNLFYSTVLTTEDTKRIEMYKEQRERDNLKREYETMDDFLMALGLKIKIFLNDSTIIPRVSQLTQKTNQFNLTTRRYSENEIEFFINNPKSDVLAISVSDKFGDNGITGLAILNQEGKVAYIDTFLMSCRIIGRNAELVFFDFIIDFCKKKNIEKVFGEYIKTLKNEQVSNFLDKLNFQKTETSSHYAKYELLVKNYKKSNVDYISLINGR